LSKEKVCPLLEGLGIDKDEGYTAEGICQLCVLPRCVYDKPGQISWKDTEELERILKVWKKAQGEVRNKIQH